MSSIRSVEESLPREFQLNAEPQRQSFQSGSPTA